MNDLTPEERVRRVKAALAEAGYPDAEVWWGSSRVWTGPVCDVSDAPQSPWWRALAVSGHAPLPCWPCFISDEYWECDDPKAFCDHDPLTSPWPEVVR